MITAGVNEKTGGATDRNDPEGRLKLVNKNAAIYRDIVPRIVDAAPQAVLLVVTDPPDPLADVARAAAGHDRIISAGTYLDSQRFRVHLAQHFGVDPATVEAQVLGEHGTSQVFAWSTARVGGVPVAALLAARGEDAKAMHDRLEKDVRYANITIIEGHDASQYGIAIVACRIAEMILRDERAAIPVGSHHEKYGVTLSLPSVVGRSGVVDVLAPQLSAEEDAALVKSAANIAKALGRVR
jgi:L-lactate dehydrogenase